MNRRCFLNRGFALTAGGIFVPRIIRAQSLGDPAFVSGLTQPAAGASPSYLIEETFEGSGLPSGWTDSSTGGTRDFDYTTTVLEGTESFFFNDPGGAGDVLVTAPLPSTYDSIYVSLRVRCVTVLPNNGTIFLRFQDGSGTALADLKGDTVGNYVQTHAAGGTISSGLVGMSLTDYYKIKLLFQKGTGSNCSLTAWSCISGGGSWSASVASTNGTSTAQVGKLQFTFFHNSTSAGFIIDKLQVSLSDINVADA